MIHDGKRTESQWYEFPFDVVSQADGVRVTMSDLVTARKTKRVLEYLQTLCAQKGANRRGSAPCAC